jgi:hypothetical protein
MEVSMLGLLSSIFIGIIVIAFLIYATKKQWVDWHGGHGIAHLTAFHDFQPKDKQEAIEIVIERKAGAKIEEQNKTDPPSPG